MKNGKESSSRSVLHDFITVLSLVWIDSLLSIQLCRMAFFSDREEMSWVLFFHFSSLLLVLIEFLSFRWFDIYTYMYICIQTCSNEIYRIRLSHHHHQHHRGVIKIIRCLVLLWRAQSKWSINIVVTFFSVYTLVCLHQSVYC